jgi:hypothetical protein
MKRYTLIWSDFTEPEEYDTEDKVWNAIGERWCGYTVIHTKTGKIATRFIPF